MKKYYILVAVPLLFMLVAVMAENSREVVDICKNSSLNEFVRYRKVISKGGETIGFFNLRYLSDEMKKNGIPKIQHGDRLSKYTYEIDKRQSEVVGISGSYTRCGQGYTQLVLEVMKLGSGGKTYLSVRFIDGKIINVSEESVASLVDGMPIGELDYTPLNIDFTSN